MKIEVEIYVCIYTHQKIIIKTIRATNYLKLICLFNMVSLNAWSFGAIIISNLLMLSIIGMITACCCAKKKRRARTMSNRQSVAAVAQPPSNSANQVWEVSIDTLATGISFKELGVEKPVRFSAQQLYSFTNNYSTRLGSGGFGVVFKGMFPNGVPIAVKVLKRSSDKAAEQQFMAEVATISRTYHINLVKLYGFCYDHLKVAVVYEYMENGSLDNYLFRDTHTIEWEKLYEISIGAARGIAYLHEECQPRIIHYDIKPGNVLLDSNFSPKIADFGLAKLCNSDGTHVSVTGYRGTPGYSAPEFLLKNFPITNKCDVYSFGMLLFEIVGRRRNANSSPTDSLDWFPKRVWDEYENGALDKMAKSCGIEEEDMEKAERVAMVALWCAQDSPDDRPPMSDVVKMLEGEVEIMPPSKPFDYLFSTSTKTPKSHIKYSSGKTYFYPREESTPIMTEYDIQFSNSDYSS